MKYLYLNNLLWSRTVLTFSIENRNKWLKFLQLLYENFASFPQLFTVETKKKILTSSAGNSPSRAADTADESGPWLTLRGPCCLALPWPPCWWSPFCIWQARPCRACGWAALQWIQIETGTSLKGTRHQLFISDELQKQFGGLSRILSWICSQLYTQSYRPDSSGSSHWKRNPFSYFCIIREQTNGGTRTKT